MLSYIIHTLASTVGNFGSVGAEWAMNNIAGLVYRLGS